MISVRFFEKQGKLSGVSVSGHAGYAAYGQDIVCASVTSAVQLTANGITEILKVPCDVSAQENCVTLMLGEALEGEEEALHFLQALYLQLSILAEDYPRSVKVVVSQA